jgi:hypothetical protein
MLEREDILQRMTKHASFNCQLEVRGRERTVCFHRGDLIYTLPDPEGLDVVKHDKDLSGKRAGLRTKDLCVAQIADCCVLKTTAPEEGGTPNFGFLRVRWLYSQGNVQKLHDRLKVPHSQRVGRVRRMSFESHEVRESSE